MGQQIDFSVVLVILACLITAAGLAVSMIRSRRWAEPGNQTQELSKEEEVADKENNTNSPFMEPDFDEGYPYQRWH